jgi:hypothetical protein
MLERVIDFLQKIGLGVVIEPGATGFTEGVRIDQGVLHVDPDCLPSVLLHEAGHIAITPGRFRFYMDGDLRAGIRRMIADIEGMNLPPDDPLECAVVQCSDPEATAWAWAAGLSIGLPPEAIIDSNDYQGGGDNIRIMLQVNRYAGINGMARAGMCRCGFMDASDVRYPVMQRWLQDY